MKKYIKYITLLLLLVPIFLKATENYSGAISRANNYINEDKFSDRKKYLIYGAGTPYGFLENRIRIDGSFKNGWEYKWTNGMI